MSAGVHVPPALVDESCIYNSTSSTVILPGRSLARTITVPAAGVALAVVAVYVQKSLLSAFTTAAPSSTMLPSSSNMDTNTVCTLKLSVASTVMVLPTDPV